MSSKIRGTGISPDDPSLPEPVKKRWKLLDERALARAEAIHHSIGQKKLDEFGTRIHALVSRHQEPPRLRLRGLYQIANEMMAHTAGQVACKRGCNHCCYIGVPIAPIEADLIGADIGMKRKFTPLRNHADSLAYAENFPALGYARPCTFLVKGECSIYENRPLVCRVHYSVDDDDFLCRLDHPVQVPVPYLDITPYKIAYVAITGEKMADVREFFPKGRGEQK